MSKFNEMVEKFEAEGMEYVGDSTMYSRFCDWGTVAGYKGRWIHAEFGGMVFNPNDTRSCFAKVQS